MEFGALTEKEVRGLKFTCNNFLQSWEMYQRYQDLGREAYFVGVRGENGEVLAAGLMLAREWRLKKKIFRVPGGWLMDYDAIGAGSLSKRSTSSKLGLENVSDSSRMSSREASSSRERQSELAKIASSITGEEVLRFLTEKAKEFCAKKGGIALEIAPNIVAQTRDAHNNVIDGEEHLIVKAELEKIGYKYLGEYEQVKWTFVKDVRGGDAEEMFKAFRTDHRQRIRRAEREGVRIRELSDDEIGILKEIAAEAGVRHGFKDPDMEYYRSMKKAFGNKVKFMVAELPAEKVDGKAGEYVPLAAAMFVNDGNELVYLYSGSVRDLQKYGGAHLMQWVMIQEAMRTGCKKYNFYGVRPVEGDGVYNFKLGFRGQVEELLGTFILPIGLLGKLYTARLKSQEYGSVH